MENEIKKSQSRYTQLADTLPEIKYWKLLQPKKSITAVQKTREMLELVINNIPQLIYWKDINLMYLGCNTNFAVINGLINPSSIIGRSDNDLKWVINKSDYIQECEHNVMRKNEPEYNVIELLISPDGKQTWYEINRIPLKNLRGKVVGILVTYENITIRKLSEKKLKESEEMYRNLFESTPYSITLMDFKGTIVDCNRSAEKIFGYNREELLGELTTKPVFPSKFLPLILENLKKISQGIVPDPQEVQVIRKDGSLIWVLNQGSLVKIGEKKFIQNITQDISKIKESDLKIRESEKKYRTIFNSSPDYIYITDLEGNFLDMNLALLDRIGMTLEEVRGMNFAQFYIGDKIEDLLLVRDEIMAGKEIKGLEIKARAKTGEIFEYEVNSVPIKENGK
ncbi:MAG: PAS domain S-box protein, partial [Candidatus Lokiarchaeota archaeon]|nr:PAS domain S-box protein [Candidatus Lokiarchaeota archaeon]